jgi:putative phosphoesterase
MPAVRLFTTPPPPEQVISRIGLIADTHMPDRLPALPDTIGVAFADVDLILHAGDVGELGVLDQLSMIAPVLAVHGNDDTLASQRELPLQQLLSVAGLRLLLTHSHYPDRADELASRAEDRWAPKLDWRAAMGRRAEAQIVVFGHTHVPMTVLWGDTLLINPGAIAPGTHFARPLIASVARLLICTDGAVAVEHIDLADPQRSFVPPVDLEAGFSASINQVQTLILAEDMLPLRRRVAALFAPDGLDRDAADTVREVLCRLAYPCWIGERDLITRAEFEAAMRRELPADLWQRAIEIMDTV